MIACQTLLVIGLLACISRGVPLTAEADNTEDVQPRVSYSKNTVTKEGQDVSLDCAVEGLDLSNVENFRIDWSKIDEANPVESLPITNGETLVYSPNGKYELIRPENTFQYTLKIHGVTAEDTGLYRCLVYFTEDQFVTAKIYVDLEQSPYFSDNSTKQVVVTEGDNVSIECKPAGVPEPEAVWEKVQEGPLFYGGSVVQNSVLQLPSVSITDSGRYSCHASNGVEPPAQIQIVLTVQYEPIVTLSGAELGADINQEFMLTCRVDALPAANISWFKEGQELLGDINYSISEVIEEQPEVPDPIQAASQSTVKVSTLSILKVTMETLGQYSCSAKNDIETVKQTTTLSLKTPPKIESQSEGEVFYLDEQSPGRSGLPVSIDCGSSGVPPPKYKWLKNGEPLHWESDSRFSLDPKSGSLLIEDPTLKDNGWYQCAAYNSLGVAMSDPVYLYNSSRVEFDNANSVAITLEAEEGRPFQMKCPNATSEPPPELTWVISSPPKDDKVQMEFFSSNRTVVGPDGTAYFAYVTQKDSSEVSDKVYMCVGRNEASPQDFSIGTTVTLKVTKPTDGLSNGQHENMNIEPFIMYASPEETRLEGGKDNKLWCIFGGEPEPVVVWTDEKGERIIAGAGYEYDNYNRTLVLKDTNLSHQKTYTCSGSNTVGVLVSHSMKVAVEMPPQFKEELQSIQVEEGATVQFLCGAVGTGVLTYSWYYNGREVIVEKDVRKRTEGNKLIIEPALVTDTGNYACNATSAYGYAYGQTTLNVLPNSIPNFNPSAGCAEVSELKEELSSVKETLQKLRDFVKNTRTAQADASIDLIQRIAGKLDLLTEQEKELIAAQDLFRQRQNINIQTTVKKETKEPMKPSIIRAEQQPINSRKPAVAAEEPETVPSAPNTVISDGSTTAQQTKVSSVVNKSETADTTTEGSVPTTSQTTEADSKPAEETKQEATVNKTSVKKTSERRKKV